MDWLKVRAFQNAMLEGTVPTKWAYAVNGARQKDRKISSLRNTNGDTTTDKEEIAKVAMEYWKDLLTKRETDENKDMATKVQRLNKKDREEINKEITLEEMQTATQQLANNKTPEPDGIPAEVHKLYPKMVRLLHKTWTREHDITGRMGQSNMVLIYKGKGEREEMANYRPLQMLNTDYKTVAKALANRLQRVIQNVVHPDQTGFIKGRNIKDNIMETYLATVASKEGALILLDFEKAYDRMDRGWIKTVMTNMKLGARFIDWSMKLIEQS